MYVYLYMEHRPSTKYPVDKWDYKQYSMPHALKAPAFFSRNSIWLPSYSLPAYCIPQIE